MMYLFEGLLRAYGQLFFSKSRLTAYLVLLATFVDPDLGLWGALGGLLANLLAHVFGFDRHALKDGLYALNAAMVSFAVAARFEPNLPYLVLWASLVLLTVLLTVALTNLLARVGVPALSLPALVALWFFYAAAGQFGALLPDLSGIFRPNELFEMGGLPLVRGYEFLNGLLLPEVLDIYLRSLSTIVFQDNLLTGLLMMLALLIASRIAFTLSWVGFWSGFAYCHFLQADISQLVYGYIGFNFILTGIALGGFFFVPSWRTYLLVAGLSPFISLLIAAFSSILAPLHLPVFSLPFLFTVIFFLYVFYFVQKNWGIQKVVNQQYSPEGNLYAFQNYMARFGKVAGIRLVLPFFGEWRVGQGQKGELTHLEDWQYAWDFDIVDADGLTYRAPGTDLEHYRCYNLPVRAPADGYVVHIADHVPDNPIGDANVKDNWGNAIVVKHAENLYSKLAHLKEGSFKVAVGDFVRRGDVLAHLGNSGRSPEPHLHFQLQATPYIGSKTLQYPLAHYLYRTDKGWVFRHWDYPSQNESVQNVRPFPMLAEAFRFVPGQQFSLRAEDGRMAHWEAGADAWNNTYLWCRDSQSTLFFHHDGTLFYGTRFEGDKKSWLYAFYLATHRLLLGYYPDLPMSDVLPLHEIKRGIARWPQDFLAPFYMFTRIEYRSGILPNTDALRAASAELNAQVVYRRGPFSKTEWTFGMKIEEKMLVSFSFRNRTVSQTIAVSVS
jgi:urea transporter/murein DD-endopeptidase MepM/ murein hydrolase activator NlpD